MLCHHWQSINNTNFPAICFVKVILTKCFDHILFIVLICNVSVRGYPTTMHTYRKFQQRWIRRSAHLSRRLINLLATPTGPPHAPTRTATVTEHTFVKGMTSFIIFSVILLPLTFPNSIYYSLRR